MRAALAAGPRRRVLVALCFSAGLAGLSVAVTGPLLVDIAGTYRISVALAGLAAAFAAWGLSRGVVPQRLEAPGYLQAFRSVLQRPAGSLPSWP